MVGDRFCSCMVPRDDVLRSQLSTEREARGRADEMLEDAAGYLATTAAGDLNPLTYDAIDAWMRRYARRTSGSSDATDNG
jgi:hypothetical protein